MRRRALLSVSNKSGLVEFARGLAAFGFEIYSTGGTHRTLSEAGLPVQPVTELTGFPEIMDGRVKTLHPGVHAGLLARRDKPEHLAALREHGLAEIDVLGVNLYPFVATATRDDVSFEDVVEQIDIGGPAMVRAAAKNHLGVVVVVRPERYGQVLDALRDGEVSVELRRRLAAEAFAHTAAYDAAISGWLGEAADGAAWPADITFGGELVRELRYGEIPHQRAAFYRLPAATGGLGGARQLRGGELSYNNIQDAAAAFGLATDFDLPAAAVIKHTNPCGCAIGDDLADAYRKAYEVDTVSAYGGVIALNRECDAGTAEQIGSIFVEVVVAPSFSAEAVETLGKKPKVRLLQAVPARTAWRDVEVRSVPGGLLVQAPDRATLDRASCSIPSQRQPSEAEWSDLDFAWRVVKHVKSNAVVLAKDGVAVGVGAGQMSRVEAVTLAARRAGDRAAGGVMASDAFFPFPDGVEEGLRAGVAAVIQPGGSIRDREAIAAVDAAGASMVLTGVRHFRH